MIRHSTTTHLLGLTRRLHNSMRTTTRFRTWSTGIHSTSSLTSLLAISLILISSLCLLRSLLLAFSFYIFLSLLRGALGLPSSSLSLSPPRVSLSPSPFSPSSHPSIATLLIVYDVHSLHTHTAWQLCTHTPLYAHTYL